MNTSDAKRRANQKHIQEKLDEVKVRPPKGTKDRWKAAAEAAGYSSLQKFIIDAVETAVEAVEAEKPEA